jgi:hypothetical protein
VGGKGRRRVLTIGLAKGGDSGNQPPDRHPLFQSRGRAENRHNREFRPSALLTNPPPAVIDIARAPIPTRVLGRDISLWSKRTQMGFKLVREDVALAVS